MQGPRLLRDRMRTLPFAAVILTLAGSAFAAEKVAIETGLHDGYGRIVFAWPDPIKFEAALSDSGVTIRFERPLEADLAMIATQLPNYVESAEMDGENTVLVILKGPVGLRSLALGKRAAIDLIGPAGSEAQPPQDKPVPAGRAAAKPQVVAAPASAEMIKPESDKAAVPQPQAVAVRRLEEDGVHRLVFDWPRPASFNVKVVNGEATIRFNQAGTIDG